MDSKTPLKIKIFDTLLVTGLFLSLIPIRIAFVTFVGNSWVGSFGLLTGIVTIIIILTFKNKLGWFGRSIKRFFMKRHKKKRILMIIQFCIATFMLSTFIYGVNLIEENDKFTLIKGEIIALLPNAGMTTTDEITELALEDLKENPEMIIVAIGMFFYLIVYNFESFALVMWTINHITDGLYMNFATIFLVEEIEVMGIFAFFHFFNKKIQQT